MYGRYGIVLYAPDTSLWLRTALVQENAVNRYMAVPMKCIGVLFPTVPLLLLVGRWWWCTMCECAHRRQQLSLSSALDWTVIRAASHNAMF